MGLCHYFDLYVSNVMYSFTFHPSFSLYRLQKEEEKQQTYSNQLMNKDQLKVAAAKAKEREGGEGGGTCNHSIWILLVFIYCVVQCIIFAFNTMLSARIDPWAGNNSC